MGEASSDRLRAHRALTRLYKRVICELEGYLRWAQERCVTQAQEKAGKSLEQARTKGKEIIRELHRFVAEASPRQQFFVAISAEGLLLAANYFAEREPSWQSWSERLYWAEDALPAIRSAAEWAEKHFKDSKVSGEAQG